MQVNTRKSHWETKRVFFATPQVIYNDIKSGTCPGDKIRCLVIDEAHKAKGNYAYSSIIKTLTEMGYFIYRVLALSATPGNKVEDVIHIVKHLHISRLELRTENCLDVKAYSHVRNINTVVVELGHELTKLREQYVEILDGYTRKLTKFNIIQNLGNLSKGRIVMLYKEFQNRERAARHPQHSYIMRTFTLLITLYHGLELLVKHGSRVFLNFFDEHPEKTWVHEDNELTSFFDKLRDKLGVNPLDLDKSVLPDGTVPEVPSNLNFGHPKFDKLKEIIMRHFDTAKNKGQVTKAIVFCEYRESVNLVYCLLLQCRPTIVPEMFVGHGASGKDGKTVISQKQQLRVMRNFRSGVCNTLVCTCVAEEGLDVGSVDLILCFDVSTRSPIRLVQRCGRTGRERSGQVFILVTEGREHSTLLDCIRQNDGLNQKILMSEEVKKSLYKSNPRMIPTGFMPECQKMFITVAKKEPKDKPKDIKEKSKGIKEKAKDKLLKGQKDLRSMLMNKGTTSKTQRDDTSECREMISKQEFDVLFPEGYEDSNVFKQPNDCWALNEFLKDNNNIEAKVKPSPQWEPQKVLQNTFKVKNSSDTKMLIELFQQTKNTPITKSPVKKDGDIRVLFSKCTKSIKNYTKSVNELGINSNSNISNDILNLLVDLSLENKNIEKRCYVCSIICKCSGFIKKADHGFNDLYFHEPPVLPDIELIDYLTKESIKNVCEEINTRNISSNEYDDETNITNVDEYVMKSTDFNVSVGNMKESNVESDVKQIEIVSHNVNYSDDDLFEGSDLFDEIDFPTGLCDELPKDSELTDKSMTEICSRDTSKNSTDISDKHLNEPFSQINTEIKSHTDMYRVETNKNEIKNNSMIINYVNDVGNKNTKDHNIIEVEDVFDDFDEFYNTTTNLTPPLTYKHENELEKSPILSTVKTSKIERGDRTVNRYDKCDQQDMLEVNDIFDDLNTSELISARTKSTNNNNKYSKLAIRDTNEDFECIIINNEDITDINTKNCLSNESDAHGYIDTSNDTITETSTAFNKTNINDVLKYFHLDKISDIFQNNNNGIQETNWKRKNNKLSNDLLDVTEIYNKSNDIIEIKDDGSYELFNDTILEGSRSPSLLSGRSQTIVSSRSSSPILNTQRPKKNNSNKQTSPILSSQRRKMSLNINRSDKKLNSPISIGQTSLIQKVNSKSQVEPDHRKTVKLETNNNKNDLSDIIILDSDDDCEDDKHVKHNTTKRKLIDVECESPYFKKKPKLEDNGTKPLSIKEKVMAALTSHQNLETFHNDVQINYALTSPIRDSTKENKDPFKSKLEMLKKFQYDNKNKSNTVLKETKHNISYRVSDSDDDFVSQVPYKKKILTKLKRKSIKTKTKEAKKPSEFLDLEAELSEDEDVSEDELTDDSTDSIKNFICDDNVTKNGDIQAMYLESIKSPVKGVFKLPQLPALKKHEVFSQYVEEDTYEMDSFCVDSHVVYNETHEMSELEIAEMILEERRRNRRNKNQVEDTEGSPVIKKNCRKNKRQINSDSEDSN
ncbi:unnamed protein product [Danaus chrysippus]|uniref:(African queen) hypothetical protein n=1 Tax=Danaus chrysippus TaxID=151541 RepID=A0A8J2QCR3_9NEOP|nr:unnamed protein product [Danaus chrysippus]